MARYLLTVESDCAEAGKEREFNEWYDNVHVPDVLEIPGVVRGTRYEALEPAPGTSKYFATYEVETDDIQAFTKAALEYLAKKRAQGRMSPLLKMQPPRVLRQIFSRSR